MVVRMKMGKSIKGVLNYNEQKVRQGAAELLLASGFSCDVQDLGFSEKLKRFDQLIQRNEKSKTNTVHISLNFPPGENLDTETLQNIAVEYMDRIGFGQQPYLVYRHDDSSHPHIHIVTTSIKRNGRPINLHNIGKLKSEPARKALEKEYGLIQAESRKKQEVFTLTPASLQAAQYGKAETRGTISNIVREVTANYKYTSLEELNAILRIYNVTAYRGVPGSRQYNYRGLSYSMVDKDGYKIGIPVKASAIYTSPTLDYLEKKFEQNRVKRIPYKKYVQAKVDAVVSRSKTLDHFINGLKEKNIQCHFQRDRKGNIQQINFIDPFNRTIFNAQELGYSTESLFDKFKPRQAPTPKTFKKEVGDTLKGSDSIEQFKMDISLNILKTLLANESTGPDLDPAFSRKKRKKRKKP